MVTVGVVSNDTIEMRRQDAKAPRKKFFLAHWHLGGALT
jgi:hypothetical protein